MCDYSVHVLQYPLQWVEINVNIHEGKGLRQWPVEMFNSYYIIYNGKLNCLFIAKLYTVNWKWHTFQLECVFFVHSGKSATVRESYHGSGVFKEHYA